MENKSEYVLEARGITKYYGMAAAVKDVDFSLKKGEIHALLGANGAGKSTLLKIFDGIIQDYEGSLFLHGRKTFITSTIDAQRQGLGMVHQELTVLPNISIAENIYINRLPRTAFGKVQWKKLYSDSKKVLESLGLDIDPSMLLSNLSVADRQIVEIARIVSMDSPIILLDEPTSALSKVEIDRLLELIIQFKNEGKSVIFITHKLEEILAVSDRVSVLRDGMMIETVEVTDRSDDFKEHLISSMIGMEKGDLGEMFPPKNTNISDEVVLEVENLNREKVFRNVSFKLRRGEVCVFTGLKGAKRTEVMRALFGVDKYNSGTVRINGMLKPRMSIRKSIRNGMGMVTEDRKGEGIVAMMSVKNNIALSTIYDCTRLGFVIKAKINEKAKIFEKKLHMKIPSIDVAISALSGGNQQKVVLSKWLAAKPDILIFDEPTRGIDVGAKVEIYKIIQQLAEEGTAILVVSSELPEVIGLANRVYVMSEGEIVGELSDDEINNETIMRLMFSHKTDTGGVAL